MPKQEKTCPYVSLLVLFCYGTDEEHRFDFLLRLSWVVYENNSFNKHVRRMSGLTFQRGVVTKRIRVRQ